MSILKEVNNDDHDDGGDEDHCYIGITRVDDTGDDSTMKARKEDYYNVRDEADGSDMKMVAVM